MESVKNITTSFNPSSQQISKIEKWLFEEDRTANEGFYYKWEEIKSWFQKKQVIIASVEGRTIGFAAWRITSRLSAVIEFTEIQPSERGKGYSKILLSSLFAFLEQNGILVISLQCAPASSEVIWKKFGFEDMFLEDEQNFQIKNKQLYKTLVRCQKVSDDIPSRHYLQLWDREFINTDALRPTWTWNLDFIEGSENLKVPIIHPCHYDWRIKWGMGTTCFNDCQISRWGKQQIVFDDFLIFTNLPKSN
ncbi:GNAT family N-acetyltransferase [Dyadobacter sp. 3J3]|uniref:GNAT family N-acetyltransferase n=1 Tax=Dyadobacter sp. 3J3 TaxID=2606600 RepID=UPI001356E8B8|nr:GNAT family N-acetyltransferase [Dyadobacter sp. 3J3]